MNKVKPYTSDFTVTTKDGRVIYIDQFKSYLTFGTSMDGYPAGITGSIRSVIKHGKNYDDGYRVTFTYDDTTLDILPKYAVEVVLISKNPIVETGNKNLTSECNFHFNVDDISGTITEIASEAFSRVSWEEIAEDYDRTLDFE